MPRRQGAPCPIVLVTQMPSFGLPSILISRVTDRFGAAVQGGIGGRWRLCRFRRCRAMWRSEEHTSELQSHLNLVCRLLLEKKNKHNKTTQTNEKIQPDITR